MPVDDESPYASANIARIPSSDKDKLSATLVARHTGCLAIKVTFHRVPCVGVEVKFFETDDAGQKGAAVGDPMKTGKNGVAKIDYLVPAGLYVAELEGQSPALVSTVREMRRPFVVVTPVDRPYFDADESEEFDDEMMELEDVAEGEKGAEAVDGVVEDEGVMTISFALKGGDQLDDAYPRYVLTSADRRYSRELSARNDLVEGDDWLQLRFDGLKPGQQYTLTKVLGPGNEQVLFDKAEYDAIIDRPNEMGSSMKEHAYGGIAVAEDKTPNEKWG